MGSALRDGLVAVAALVVLVATALVTTGTAVFVRPAAVAVGVTGAVAIEAVFLRYPDRLLPVWERPLPFLAGVAALGCLAVVAVRAVPWVLGAVSWGLVTYLALLGCVLTGIGNPVAVLVSSAPDRD
ncbi:hypothetical protein [Halorientalis salina]|uniref:hypothetical protein n=1 Tax=Halorientalis salina TaxID=2932266 RepID=UPI002022B0D8|nr:hypothetical protein [Halorientalis salina]